MTAKDLYREVQGQGEPVLIIQGALAEAETTVQLATQLVEAGYQVITYDHRGLSRSVEGETVVSVTIGSHAADAAALLRATVGEPARVLGTSIGAVIGLELVQQHPELVRALIAHEPPLPAVDPDPEQLRGLEEVAELARSDAFAAARHFATLGGPRDDGQEDGANPPAPVGDMARNMRQFFGSDFEAVCSYSPDLDALRTADVPIILTGGAQSRGRWEYRCAQALADRLGVDLLELPGGHSSLASHPQGTAAVLLPELKEV